MTRLQFVGLVCLLSAVAMPWLLYFAAGMTVGWMTLTFALPMGLGFLAQRLTSRVHHHRLRFFTDAMRVPVSTAFAWRLDTRPGLVLTGGLLVLVCTWFLVQWCEAERAKKEGFP